MSDGERNQRKDNSMRYTEHVYFYFVHFIYHTNCALAYLTVGVLVSVTLFIMQKAFK